MQISIEISDEQLAQLTPLLLAGRYEDRQQCLTALLGMAAQSWVDWVTGTKRYNSLTEQYTDWVEQLYAQLMPSDEAPSPERLFNTLNIPYGQAQYIARVLNNRQLAHWRGAALQQLVAALNERKEEVRQWIDSGFEDETVELRLLKPAYQELKVLQEELYRKNPREVSVPQVKSVGALVEVRLQARAFQKVCLALDIW